MTVHRDRFLVNKTKRRTEFQFFIGNNNSACFGQSFYPSSGASQPYNGIGTIWFYSQGTYMLFSTVMTNLLPMLYVLSTCQECLTLYINDS